MKVAVYVPQTILPEDGGAYGYVHNLFFKHLPKIKDHVFYPVIFSTGQPKSEFLDLLKQHYKCFHIPRKYSDIPLYIRPVRKLSTILKNTVIGECLSDFVNYVRNKTLYLNRICFDEWIENEEIEITLYPFPSEMMNYATPYVYTVYDLCFLSKPHFPEFRLQNSFQIRDDHYKYILPRAARIIAESLTGKNEIIAAYKIPSDNIEIIPLPVGPIVDIEVTELEKNFFLSKIQMAAGKYIFYPAQFWPHKNHKTLIKAMFLVLNEKGKLLKLILPGSDKGTRKSLQLLVSKLDLQNDVFFPGFITDKELKILYNNALCMVMPTLMGPTNMPVVEAVAVGCPVICSDLPGHREQTLDAALYFNPTDEKELAEKIIQLLDSSLLKNQMIESGKKVYSDYNRIDYAQHLNKILDELSLEIALVN